MDSLSTQPQPVESQIKETKQPNALKYIGIGFLELGFIMMLLLLIFVLLKFFNVISLGKTFSIFSSLPYPINSTSTQIHIPRDTQDSSFMAYIKQSFVPSVLPYNFNQPSFTISHISSLRVAEWSNGKTTFTISMYANSKTQKLVKYTIYIGPLSNFSISSSSAETVAKKYLKDLTEKSFSCNQLSTLSYCETFTSSNDKKTGYGLIQHKNNNIYFFSCLIPVNSPLFPYQQSCALL